MDNRVSKRSRRFDRGLQNYTRVVSAVRAYWGAILISSCMLFFVALTFSGKIPTKLEPGPLALLAPILAWLGLAGMAVIGAVAVRSRCSLERAGWVLWVSGLILLATIIYGAVFPYALPAVALGLWYAVAFFFFNEEIAARLIPLLFW